ncbi:MAG: DAK2 domain-containing protein [Anaerolineae bacterium]
MTSNISLRLESGSARPDPGRQHGPSAAPASDSGHPLIDGPTLKTMIAAGYAWLERHKEIVNALNVFPVPDGDTGTNMFLTMRAAWREIEHDEDGDVSHIAQAVAQGALMGARGNSGVILSQILRGMAHAFRHKPVINAHDLAHGLRHGSDTAYKGVVKPVEGTILTVIRQAADAAQKAAAVEDDLNFVLAHTVQAAAEAVEQTPTLLPVLARAGVVDSGGKGLFYILEGMQRSLRGDTVAPPVERAASAAAQQAAALDPYNLPPIRYGFDVQFLIWGADLQVDAIRSWMIEHGDFALVEGGPTLIKVHVHVFDPSAPLAYGVQQGFITDVVVENMDAMAAAGMTPDDVKDALSTAKPSSPLTAEHLGPIGVVAVAPGPGLAEVFESLGVGSVVSGGQTMNPSIQELLDAIDALPTEEVILLPNNGNVIMAAQGAAQEAARRGKRVEVIPSRTAPQGISALLAFNMQASLDDNVATMARALAAIDTGEVTMAVRDAHIDGMEVRAGDVIGLLNDTLTTNGASPHEVVFNLLAQMDAGQAEIITVYYGDQIDAAAAAELGDELGALYPDQEIEVIAGGQPHYHFILSTE